MTTKMNANGPVTKYCDLKNCSPEDIEKAVREGDQNATTVWCAEQVTHEVSQVLQEVVFLRGDNGKSNEKTKSTQFPNVTSPSA